MVRLILEAVKEWVEELLETFEATRMGYVTPEMFGAKGNGTADDTQAFINAFASCKNVKCMPSKTYKFNNLVDISTLSTGSLDLNGSTLVNFNIKIAIKEVYKATVNYPADGFTIKNGRIGTWNVKSDNWETPVIQSGTRIKIENIVFTNCPYILAITNSYRDGLEFRKLNRQMNMSLFTDESFDLDAVNVIKTDGTFARANNYDVANIPSEQQRFAGDCWVVEQVNEFSQLDGSDYAFIHFQRNTNVIVSKCIQSKFVVGQYAQITFDGCHWENASTMPEIYDLTDATTKDYTALSHKIVTFRSCLFWNNYQIEANKPFVHYLNCSFIVHDTTIPLATLMGGKDLYDVQCSIDDCLFDERMTLDAATFIRYRDVPKKTRGSMNETANEVTMASKIAATRNIATGTACVYPAVGTYHYTAYSYATGYNLAHEKYEYDRVIADINSADDSNSQNIVNLNGGWRFEIYRTLPSGTIQLARFYSDPNNRGISGNAYFRWNDKGTYLLLTYSVGSVDNELRLALPWIEVTSVPNRTVNVKAYEKNGVLVTIDNTQITGLYATSPYTQVADEKFEKKVSEIAALPTASATFEGKSYLLTAAQTGYVKGGIYKCESDGASTPTYSWVPINVNALQMPNSSELATAESNTPFITEMQSELAAADNYVVKLKDMVNDDNYYIGIANGKLVGFTEAQLNAALGS